MSEVCKVSVISFGNEWGLFQVQAIIRGSYSSNTRHHLMVLKDYIPTRMTSVDVRSNYVDGEYNLFMSGYIDASGNLYCYTSKTVTFTYIMAWWMCPYRRA